MTQLIDHAIQYAERGFAVFPLQPGTKIPFAGTRGHQEATTNIDCIQDWWSHVPDANIGIATTGLVVIDIDRPDHPWLSEHSFPNCPMSLTPRSNGRHYMYRQHDQQVVHCSVSKIAPKIDIRADGGYIVAPPSIIAEGMYRFAPAHALECDIDQLPLLPDWISALIQQADAAQNAAPLISTTINENRIPDGQRNSTLMSLAGHMRRCGMGHLEIEAALQQTNNLRCVPPLESSEVRHIATSAVRYEPDQVTTAIAEHHFEQLAPQSKVLQPVAASQLLSTHNRLKPPLIHGVLRRGETMNVVAAPKVGKSWLVLDMALAIANGAHWLDTYRCQQGRVLLIDNELHPETSADRLGKVLRARHLQATDLGDHLHILNLRGRLLGLDQLAEYLAQFEPGYFSAIIIDAWYRAIPQGTDENDNGGIARLYNLIDRSAAQLESSFILIHHTSKGNQAGKSVTDVGSGAGSQSRAADVHMGLRAHKEPGAIVLDAAVRSWKPNRTDLPALSISIMDTRRRSRSG